MADPSKRAEIARRVAGAEKLLQRGKTEDALLAFAVVDETQVDEFPGFYTRFFARFSARGLL